MKIQSPSVLLVDDDLSLQRMLSLFLEREGCRIDLAGDGEEALRKLRKNRYTTILLDLLMPRVNGFEVLQDLRALQPDVLPDVAVLTGASDGTLAYFQENGICSLLRKPVDRTEVLEVIDACAERHGVSRPSRSSSWRSSLSSAAKSGRVSFRSNS